MGKFESMGNNEALCLARRKLLSLKFWFQTEIASTLECSSRDRDAWLKSKKPIAGQFLFLIRTFRKPQLEKLRFLTGKYYKPVASLLVVNPQLRVK